MDNVLSRFRVEPGSVASRSTFWPAFALMLLALPPGLSGCGGGGADTGPSAGENQETGPSATFDITPCRRAAAPDPAAPAEFSLSSLQLLEEYKQDWKATRAKYLGKVVEVSCFVTGFFVMPSGEYALGTMNEGDEGSMVFMMRWPDENLKQILARNIHVRGVFSDAPMPSLIHCIVTDISELSRAPAGGAPSKVSPENPDFTITSQELHADFRKDQKAAAKKYAGRQLEVSGRLELIAHVSLGEISYRLAAGTENGTGPQCYLKYGSPWHCARPGQTVTLRGRGHPYAPVLLDCEITGLRGPRVMPLTTPALAEEFEERSAEFKKQRSEQQILVEGVVESREASETGPDVFLFLKSERKTRVRCAFDSCELGAINSINVDDKISLIAWCATPQDSGVIPLQRCLLWRGDEQRER